MDQIQVQTTMPAIGFNFDELMAWAKKIAARYEGVVVREEDVTAIKKDMAELNKTKKALHDARKEHVRRISEPIKTFEGQINEVAGVFDETYTYLKDQVAAHEERARQDKEREVKTIIEAVCDEHKVNGLLVPIDPRWTNKTTPLKAVKAEVESIVLNHLKELREKAELEQAKTDRAVAIEEKVKAMTAQTGVEVPVSTFLNLHDLQVPLQEALSGIEQAFASRVVAEGERTVKPILDAIDQTAGSGAVTVQEGPPCPDFTPMSKAEPQAKTMTVSLSYRAEKEPQVQAMLRHLKDICIEFTIIPGRVAA